MAAALRSSNFVKSVVGRLRGASQFSTSTTPKMKAISPSAGHFAQHSGITPRAKKGDIVPMGMAVTMITLSTGFGIYTATKELRTAPNVYVKKSRRETIPELVEPEHVLYESEKFVKKSFFRKIAHLRNKTPHDQASTDQQARMDIFSRPPKAETLKDIGIDPISH